MQLTTMEKVAIEDVMAKPKHVILNLMLRCMIRCLSKNMVFFLITHDSNQMIFQITIASFEYPFL